MAGVVCLRIWKYFSYKFLCRLICNCGSEVRNKKDMERLKVAVELHSHTASWYSP
jgi:hypothetical protein